MYMYAYYDPIGNLYTKVIETNRSLYVKKSPWKILEDSIRCVGYNVKGALETAKWLLGTEKMCPVLVNPIERIVLFPTKSLHHIDNIWFNPQHIARTISYSGKTMVLFSNGSSLIIRTRLSSFNHKLQQADQLDNLTKLSNKSLTFLLISKKKRNKK